MSQMKQIEEQYDAKVEEPKKGATRPVFALSEVSRPQSNFEIQCCIR